MRLNELRDNPGATTPRKRVGRGAGSGKGKTAGRGHKGQKSRSGVAIKGFEGGQMPIHRRLAKRGFNVPRPKRTNAVNLGRIQAAIEKGTLDAGAPVTVDALLAAGVIRRVLQGVRLLAKGELGQKVTFEVTGASEAAVKAVEAAGGTVTLAPLAAKAKKAQDAAAGKGKAKSRSDDKAVPAEKGKNEDTPNDG